MHAHAGEKFYAWLASWHWDLSELADPAGERPQDTCIARFTANKAANGGEALIDACACDAIVTDCHVNAESAGTGPPENSAPFNVYNSAGLYDPPVDASQREEWWNAASADFAWRHECAARSCRTHCSRNLHARLPVRLPATERTLF